MSLWPNEIRYSHSSMGSVFSDGTHVTQTFRDVIFGFTSVHCLPYIEVVRRGAHYYAVSGNKRLRVYKVRAGLATARRWLKGSSALDTTSYF